VTVVVVVVVVGEGGGGGGGGGEGVVRLVVVVVVVAAAVVVFVSFEGNARKSSNSIQFLIINALSQQPGVSKHTARHTITNK
jgi:hypothetical protein